MKSRKILKKVLIVSRAFPPINASGAIRVGKLAKYLSDFGWEPIVLTVKNMGRLQGSLPVEINPKNIVRIPYFDLSHSLMQLVGDNEAGNGDDRSDICIKSKLLAILQKLGVIIYNLSIFEKILPQPIGWYFPARRVSRRIIKGQKFDAIFSSYSPSASHFIASYLQRKTHVPWIAEFRDLWSLNPYSRVSNPLQFLRRQTEKNVLKNSCLLVSTSDQGAHQLKELHGKETAVIFNGFDEEDYMETVPLCPKFTITYVGNLYSRKRDPTTLFQALKRLREEGRVTSDNLVVRYFGNDLERFVSPLIQKYQLQDIVTVHGFVPFREAIRRQKESTVLLLLEWDNPSAKDIYTGKIFEYLGARRPILAIGYKSGVIDKLLSKSGTGILVNEVEGMNNILSCWLEEWHKSKEISSYWRPNINIIQRYGRKEQAKQLAQLLDKFSEPNK